MRKWKRKPEEIKQAPPVGCGVRRLYWFYREWMTATEALSAARYWESPEKVTQEGMTALRPLSAYALEELRSLSESAIPTSAINPGVVHRLLREKLAEIVQLPSPFKAHRGCNIDFLSITEAGRARLKP